MVTGIVERAGGTLLIRRRAPHPRVALLLPVGAAAAGGPDQSAADQSSSKR
jgi:hypothetical protein